jgi:hypothetical protein
MLFEDNTESNNNCFSGGKLMISKNQFSRRQFMSGTAAAITFSIVPSNVLGGAGRTAPSDRINLWRGRPHRAK